MAHSAAVAVDNDVVLKAASYGLAERLWTERLGVLGAARFVLPRALDRGRTRHTTAARKALEEVLTAAEVFEPTDEELSVAAELELSAQRAGLALDAGESQLAALVAARGIPRLDTGDKRAVTGFASLQHPTCRALRGRVRCLEQLFMPLLAADDFEDIVAAVCAEPNVDTAITICFGCGSGGASRPDEVRSGLASYVGDLERRAPEILAAD